MTEKIDNIILKNTTRNINNFVYEVNTLNVSKDMVIEHSRNTKNSTNMPVLKILLPTNNLTNDDKNFLKTNIEELFFYKKLDPVNVISFPNNFTVPDDLREALEQKSYSVFPKKKGEGYIRIKVYKL